MHNKRSLATCSFCSDDLSEVELLFRSDVGGLPPFICASCVEKYHDIIILNRADPGVCGQAVASHNALVRK